MDHAAPIPPSQQNDLDGRRVDVDAPEVPTRIRDAALARWLPGAELWRCPRAGAPRGLLSSLGIGPRTRVIEWWLLDAEGELIEAFW